MQIGGEGSKTADRLTGLVRPNRPPDFAAADINAGGIGMNNS
jgi:hypothetical protein